MLQNRDHLMRTRPKLVCCGTTLSILIHADPDPQHSTSARDNVFGEALNNNLSYLTTAFSIRICRLVAASSMVWAGWPLRVEVIPDLSIYHYDQCCGFGSNQIRNYLFRIRIQQEWKSTSGTLKSQQDPESIILDSQHWLELTSWPWR